MGRPNWRDSRHSERIHEQWLDGGASQGAGRNPGVTSNGSGTVLVPRTARRPWCQWLRLYLILNRDLSSQSTKSEQVNAE
jgi:hypothetical protein